MKKLAAISVIMVCLMLFIDQAQATLIGPVWPAPGGTNYAFSGAASDIGESNGLWITYSGFDSSEYSRLYWSSWSSTSIGLALDGAIDNTGETIPLANFGFSAEGWGATKIYEVNYGYKNVYTKFIIQAYDNNGIVLSWDPSLGLLDVASAIDSTGGFKVKLNAYASWDNTNWVAFNDFYDNVRTSPNQYGVRTEFGGGFWYEGPNAAPEPTTMLLLGLGLVGLGFAKRRRK